MMKCNVFSRFVRHAHEADRGQRPPRTAARQPSVRRGDCECATSAHTGLADPRSPSRNSCTFWLRSTGRSLLISTSIWSWITTALIRCQRYIGGLLGGPAIICSLPQQAPPGSIKSNAGLPRSPSSAFAEEPLPPSSTWKRPSSITSRPITAIQSLLSGRLLPT